jgi:hypothetical protein
VFGKNAIRKVEVPETGGANQLAVEEDRGWNLEPNDQRKTLEIL